MDREVAELMDRASDRQCGVTYSKELFVTVDRKKALFSAWYEMFPRSCATAPGNHGSFKDCEARLPYIAEMGFDILYFPPIHPQLGTIEDFCRLVNKAREYGVEIALDIAFQCTPDHPYVKEHPEWFLWRPDQTVQYAENPPKKYQDIYPLYFETEGWRELRDELKGIVLFWIEQEMGAIWPSTFP